MCPTLIPNHDTKEFHWDVGQVPGILVIRTPPGRFSCWWSWNYTFGNIHLDSALHDSQPVSFQRDVLPPYIQSIPNNTLYSLWCTSVVLFLNSIINFYLRHSLSNFVLLWVQRWNPSSNPREPTSITSNYHSPSTLVFILHVIYFIPCLSANLYITRTSFVTFPYTLNQSYCNSLFHIWHVLSICQFFSLCMLSLSW